MSDWPFKVQSIYVPESCNARQIELMTDSRIVQTNIYIGTDSPYLYVSTYKHVQAHESLLNDKPINKWLPLPQKYNIPCYVEEDIITHPNILIPSGKDLLYLRCDTKDFIENIFSTGAQWQVVQNAG
jgi:hypothetical protein